MAKLRSFMSVSLNGFYADEHGSMEFAHRADAPDPEFQKFTAGNAQQGGRLLFGRTTYEMMAGFWPTAQAKKTMPEVADGMNRAEKFVASHSLKTSDWSNTTIIKGDLAEEVAKLKQSGPDITILGSGSIVQQLADAGLMDGLSVVVLPVSLGGGKTYLAGTKGRRTWKVAESRTFRNGNLWLRYEPA